MSSAFWHQFAHPDEPEYDYCISEDSLNLLLAKGYKVTPLARLNTQPHPIVVRVRLALADIRRQGEDPTILGVIDVEGTEV